mgnify:FL=1
MKMVECPGCGNPLAKRSSKGRYYCDNESCPVIFVQRPDNLAIRRIVYKPSASEKAIRKIEKTPA